MELALFGLEGAALCEFCLVVWVACFVIFFLLSARRLSFRVRLALVVVFVAYSAVQAPKVLEALRDPSYRPNAPLFSRLWIEEWVIRLVDLFPDSIRSHVVISGILLDIISCFPQSLYVQISHPYLTN
jgi:hypothetical protein